MPPPSNALKVCQELGFQSTTRLVAQLVKNLPAIQEICVQSLGWKNPLEKEKATHSSILAWGSQRVRHDRATFTFAMAETNTTL